MPAFPRPRPPKTLEERITAANAELKAARRDGGCDAITRAAQRLDDLLDELNAKVKLHAEPFG